MLIEVAVSDSSLIGGVSRGKEKDYTKDGGSGKTETFGKPSDGAWLF